MSSTSPIAVLLRVPLIAKIAGANLIIIGIFVMLVLAGVLHPVSGSDFAVLSIAVVSSLAVTLALVGLALRPVHALELTARRIWEGDYAARVPMSPLADRSMARISVTFNTLLDRLTSDRLRVRELAAAVIRTGDRERARAATELHESAAQSIAAISWQLGALARDAADTEWERRVMAVKELAEQVLEEVRNLAQTLHPGVLDDLGLAAALTHLARQARDGSGINVVADVDALASTSFDPTVAAALYHVAQEAVANALYHGDPRTIAIRLIRSTDLTVLEVRDDGIGFDVPSHERRSGSGIFSMRERTGLVDAHLDIESAIGHGTTVRAYMRNERVRMEKTA